MCALEVWFGGVLMGGGGDRVFLVCKGLCCLGLGVCPGCVRGDRVLARGVGV